MTRRSILAMIGLLGSHPALADPAARTRRLVVTLEVAGELVPERLCIVGPQDCAHRQGCRLTPLKDVMAIPPKPGTGPSMDDDALVVARDPDLRTSKSDALHSVLTSLKKRLADECEDCRPQQRATGYMRNKLDGYIACTQNEHATNSERIALAYLTFDAESQPTPIKDITLLGNRVTITFWTDVETRDVILLESLGGDYLPGTQTGLGTNERGTLRLDPRCVTSSLVFPGRTRQRGETVEFQLDDHRLAGTCHTEARDLTIALPDRRAARPPKPPDPSAGQSPDPKAGGPARLKVTFRRGSQPGDAYEASWTEHVPPSTLKLQQREIAFSWRKDCLVGTLPPPGPTAEPTWSASCPQASLSAAGAVCIVHESRGDCAYRCEAPDKVPAFDLPTRVVFDRVGGETAEDARSAYRWEDTLTYSGQELTSFVAPDHQRIVVEFPDPAAWRSRWGNEIDRVEMRTESGAVQAIPMGELPPRWTTILVPNATCASRFTVSVVGARSFVTRDQGRERNGNLVLTSPQHYRDLIHWAVMIGGGVINPRNEFVFSSEHRAEPAGALGLGLQIYYAWPVAGAWELNLIYEPTLTAYGAIHLPSQRNERVLTVPYQRFFAESVETIWGRNRGWELGVAVGGGYGGSIHGDTEKVGINHPFLLFGSLGRVRAAFVPGWLEVDLGLRWGEHHEFFGADDSGRPIADTFHGQPAVSDRALWQVYGGVRWRLLIR